MSNWVLGDKAIAQFKGLVDESRRRQTGQRGDGYRPPPAASVRGPATHFRGVLLSPLEKSHEFVAVEVMHYLGGSDPLAEIAEGHRSYGDGSTFLYVWNQPNDNDEANEGASAGAYIFEGEEGATCWCVYDDGSNPDGDGPQYWLEWVECSTPDTMAAAP